MTNWLLMFRPETYEKVKEHGLIGVNHTQHKRIGQIQPGDRFVAYISRQRIVDGRGVFTSESFVDTEPVFGVREVYPYRARVRFDVTGAAKDAKELLWGLEEFKEGAKTTPSNMLLCRGGFMAITDEDFDWLTKVLDGTWTPETV
jgi:hypothetical protein